jgi:hypothetical protein
VVVETHLVEPQVQIQAAAVAVVLTTLFME